MDISELFHSPSNRIADFFRAQVQLYREDRSLQDYFLALQYTGLLPAPVRASPNGARSSYRRSLPIRLANQVSRIRERRKLKADVLVCFNPDFARRTETRLLIRTLLGITETGATVLCLAPANAPRHEIDAALDSVGRREQVQFVDPSAARGSAESALRRRMARMRAESDLARVTSLLQPLGLAPNPEVSGWFSMIAEHVEGWVELEQSLEFNAVVVRCHWLPLCNPVCRTALDRGVPVTTFQQGVIGHSLDAPVTATKFVAFGRSSASFMGVLDKTFYEAAHMPQPTVEYISGGCLVDDIQVLPSQFSKRTLLIVDIPTGHSDFYGVETQSLELLNLAARLLKESPSVERVIIRPHPHWSDLDFAACQRIAREHPTRCEISHPSWSLHDDLGRCSVVTGIFSGVVTVASACGLPALFLQTEGGYSTGDLAAFEPAQTLMPDDAFREIVRLMNDESAYNEARTAALRSAREYYANGATLQMTGSFFEPLLQPETRPSREHAR